MSEQVRRLAKGVDIVVGTPGRVLDHIRRGTLKLENVRYLVLDEADEMLNMGFVEDVEEIMSHTSEERRVLLFSATMPERIIRLSKTYMRDTEIVRVENKAAHDRPHRADLLRGARSRQVRRPDPHHRRRARILRHHLRPHQDRGRRNPHRGSPPAAMPPRCCTATSRRPSAKRYSASSATRSVNILVATDVAARGIDVGNLTHVINYSLPQDSESYVQPHRPHGPRRQAGHRPSPSSRPPNSGD